MATAPGIHISVQVDDFTRDLLTGAGWTPPGEPSAAGKDHITREEHHRLLAQALNEQEAWARRKLDELKQKHREQMDRLLGEQKERQDKYAKELREERIKCRSDIRAEIAEEIARDLEKPRQWTITVNEPNPWARVARAHAKTDRDLRCTICSHPVVNHSESVNGCGQILCFCTAHHGR